MNKRKYLASYSFTTKNTGGINLGSIRVTIQNAPQLPSEETLNIIEKEIERSLYQEHGLQINDRVVILAINELSIY